MIVTFLFRIFRANFDFNIIAKKSSKYPKLAFQKLHLNILQKIEKLAKIKKCEFVLKSKLFLMVSLVFFDSEQLLIYEQTPKNASKYPKLACAKIAILHPTTLKALKCAKIIFY